MEEGHAVHVLTALAEGQQAFEMLNGVHVYRVRSWRRGAHDAGFAGALSYVLFAFFRLRQLLGRNDYDLAHFFFALPTGALAAYWKRRTHRPYVVSLRGSDVPGYDDTSGMLYVMHGLLKPFTRRILSGAQQVVANSRSLRQLAMRSFPGVPISV